jgi:DNA polymerase-3 subunit alpha
MTYQDGHESAIAADHCAGYTLIKAISKKKASVIAKEKERFLAGCVDKGMKKSEAEQIFELIERFAGYGFNKSHSTRYAFIAYQTAYMKAHWPVEFMAALLTYEMGDTDKIVEYIVECREMASIGPRRQRATSVALYRRRGRQGVIRFGLAAVKVWAKRRSSRSSSPATSSGGSKASSFCENVVCGR